MKAIEEEILCTGAGYGGGSDPRADRSVKLQPCPITAILPAGPQICDAHGVLLIMDEVINGFGRTGRMLATEQFGVVPEPLRTFPSAHRQQAAAGCSLPHGQGKDGSMGGRMSRFGFIARVSAHACQPPDGGDRGLLLTHSPPGEEFHRCPLIGPPRVRVANVGGEEFEKAH